jgi:hypothetical protein
MAQNTLVICAICRAGHAEARPYPRPPSTHRTPLSLQEDCDSVASEAGGGHGACPGSPRVDDALSLRGRAEHLRSGPGARTVDGRRGPRGRGSCGRAVAGAGLARNHRGCGLAAFLPRAPGRARAVGSGHAPASPSGRGSGAWPGDASAPGSRRNANRHPGSAEVLGPGRRTGCAIGGGPAGLRRRTGCTVGLPFDQSPGRAGTASWLRSAAPRPVHLPASRQAGARWQWAPAGGPRWPEPDAEKRPPVAHPGSPRGGRCHRAGEDVAPLPGRRAGPQGGRNRRAATLKRQQRTLHGAARASRGRRPGLSPAQGGRRRAASRPASVSRAARESPPTPRPAYSP